KSFDPPEVPILFCLRDARLHLSDELFDQPPINEVPIARRAQRRSLRDVAILKRFHTFSSKETPQAKVRPQRAEHPQGHVEVCSGVTPSHLKQVSALSRWGKAGAPIRPI